MFSTCSTYIVLFPNNQVSPQELASIRLVWLAQHSPRWGPLLSPGGGGGGGSVRASVKWSLIRAPSPPPMLLLLLVHTTQTASASNYQPLSHSIPLVDRRKILPLSFHPEGSLYMAFRPFENPLNEGNKGINPKKKKDSRTEMSCSIVHNCSRAL